LLLLLLLCTAAAADALGAGGDDYESYERGQFVERILELGRVTKVNRKHFKTGVDVDQTVAASSHVLKRYSCWHNCSSICQQSRHVLCCAVLCCAVLCCLLEFMDAASADCGRRAAGVTCAGGEGW
jgi:hypothetical protein